jgi:DNA polymerase-3 subunit alpha
MTDFAHLHVHSDFSLQDAAVSVQGLADRAEELGMKYLALTDHGNMFGVMDFLAACRETTDEEGNHVKRENPIHPVIGCEVYVAPGSRFEKKGSESENRYYHLVLLAGSREGYFNLVKLCSFAYTEGFYYRPRIDDELLQKYHGGLIALSACVSGEIPRLIRAGKSDEAEAKARYYRDLFGDDNFYLEIQDHGIPAEWLKGNLSQKQINDVIVDISLRTGIPLAATNDVHYLKQEDHEAHDILLCIGTAKLRSDERRKRYYKDQFYLKSGDEMAALFPEYPEAIANTVRIAERCAENFSFPVVEGKDLPKYLPEFKIPAGFNASADITNKVLEIFKARKPQKEDPPGKVLYTEDELKPAAYLYSLTMDGLAKRYPGLPSGVVQRAEYELGVIIRMGFTGYFLIVEDFINWARERNIPVGKGRGSGPGSITAYSLRITDVEPLKYQLMFERFLNAQRISMPDFDIDFANEGREDVIRYVTEKYGKERVGQIITFGTLGAKQVIKDVARTLNISIPESEMITKLIPKDPKITLKKAFESESRLQELEKDSRYTELFSLARKLEGLNRHSSIHAAGVVIGKDILYNFVPLYRDPKTGSIATQYTMNFLEDCGLVKMDFLGLKTLDVIKHTEELIRQRGGEQKDFNIETIPETDKSVFKMLGEGKSFGIFQFESEGMQNILKQAKPDRLEDLIALNALYRPGPIDRIPQFIESKNGQRKIEYPVPSLEPVLKETYGVITYQEHVMQVAQVVAGYTLGQADILRKAMGKKKKETMVKEKERFIEGAIKQGNKPEIAQRLFELLEPFAGYGFNKSHAAAYAIIAYQTAWLKANFPAEFMAANLSNDINSTDKDRLSACIDETRKMGLVIDPPDINHSDKYFTVVEGRIVYGFLGIKGLGESSADEIIRCRKEGGPYRDFMDFLNRVEIKSVGKKVIELLAQTGAFDCFGVSRAVLQGNLEKAVEYIQNIKDERQFGQSSLFGDSGEKEYAAFIFEDFPEMGRSEKLKIEKELIGFYFSGHPMDEYRELWEKTVKVDLGRPETLTPGVCVLVGIIKAVKLHTSGTGGKMAFSSLADYNGEIEVAFFSGAWEKCRDKIEAGKIVILKGEIRYRKDQDRHSFIAEDLISPSEAENSARTAEVRSRKWDKYLNIWKYSKDPDIQILESVDVPGAAKGTYTIAGLLKSLRTHTDKNGNEMAFGTLEDYQGEIDLVFFARDWKKCKTLAAVDEMIALRGSLDPANARNPGKPGFRVSSIQDINKLVRAVSKKAAIPPAAELNYAELHIRLKGGAADNNENLYPLQRCLSEKPGPCTVVIHVPLSRGETIIRTATQTAGAALTEIRGFRTVASAWGE